VPYLLVVGDREMDSEQVAVRARGGVDLGVMGIEQFAQHLASDVARYGRETVEN
jgi:threonyl-tRNA synthetase